MIVTPWVPTSDLLHHTQAYPGIITYRYLYAPDP